MSLRFVFFVLFKDYEMILYTKLFTMNTNLQRLAEELCVFVCLRHLQARQADGHRRMSSRVSAALHSLGDEQRLFASE